MPLRNIIRLNWQQVKSMGHKKLPSISVAPKSKILPDVKSEIKSVEARNFKWRILPNYLAYSNSAFGWDKLTSDKILNIIIPKLHNYESLTWEEAQKRPHFHFWKVSKLDKQLRRLAENKGYDCLYQIDIENSNGSRIFGIRNGEVFFCVWYDSNHNGKKMS
nr:MAG TPA: hypothetical protein [Caudoviricetes sp.]